MNGKIGMRAFSALLAVLLVSVAMVPAVSAYSEAKAYEDALSGFVVEKVSETENAKEYDVTAPLKDGTGQTFFVKERKAEVDGRDVWKINVFEVDSNGVVASEPLLRDSYYWWESDGLHIHFGPWDMLLFVGLDGAAITGLTAWLATIVGGGPAGVFAAVLVAAIAIDYWYYGNTDGSMDVYLSNTTVALIPVYVVMPGPQPIVVRLGSSDVVLLL